MSPGSLTRFNKERESVGMSGKTRYSFVSLTDCPLLFAVTNRFLNTSGIFAIACLQAISIHGIIFPDAPLAVHEFGAGQPHAAHEASFLGSSSGPIQIPEYTSTISSSLEDPREDHQLAPDFVSYDDLISWEQLLHNYESSGSLPTESTYAERWHTPEYPASLHTLKSPSDELTVEDYSTLGLIGCAADAEQLNCERLPFLFGSPQSLPTMPAELNYVDNLHWGKYATGVKWPTNLIEEPASRSSPLKRISVDNLDSSPSNQLDVPGRTASRSPPLKRKSVDNSDGSPSNKLEGPQRKILGNDRELSRSSQTTSTSDDSGLTRRRQHSPEIPMASNGHHSDSVDLLGGNLRRYGILSTLRFPGKRRWGDALFSRNVLHESDLWKSLQWSCEDSTVPILVQKIIQSRVVTKSRALENARNLLEEIFLRHGQLTISFSKCRTSAESTEKLDVIKLRSKEQEKLLEWSTSLLNFEKQSETSPKEDPTGRLHSFSSCQKMLREYLSREDKKLNYLITKSYNTGKYQTVTHTSAMKTQVAINAVGNYLKYNNPNHWKDLSLDKNLLKIFGFLKRAEHSRGLHKLQNALLKWKKLELVPWDNIQRIEDDVERRKIMKAFNKKMDKQIWNLLERDYKEVENQGHEDGPSPISSQYTRLMDVNLMFAHNYSPFLETFKPGGLLQRYPESEHHKFY
ncbi:hypothetical protein Pst134EB_010012 [Puccinia striiformis f. sp. tritici]|uniref:Uncharacterized protein n=1 Tax=Puccinia striiformis f. sp. tritici PST-78 TaxID=1165861 RepID=A0A0L0VMP8_9BASI|nr:hypothetical protein Pst134EB_010012 [Puccinia striiformis f. sp. tritici]KNF00526.1 hypothetical protein PSTG_06218 [Puccinia striiformis f. sp. tritici PST-78]